MSTTSLATEEAGIVEEELKKLQALVRGYLTRNTMKQVQKKFEDIFQEIEGELGRENTKICWGKQCVSLPCVKKIKHTQKKRETKKSVRTKLCENTASEKLTEASKNTSENKLCGSDSFLKFDSETQTDFDQVVKTQLGTREIPDMNTKLCEKNITNDPLMLLKEHEASLKKEMTKIIQVDEIPEHDPGMNLHVPLPPSLPNEEFHQHREDNSQYKESKTSLSKPGFQDSTTLTNVSSLNDSLNSVSPFQVLSKEAESGCLHEPPKSSSFAFPQSLPSSPQELRALRENIAMELLWVQQAINSRKNYLRIKNQLK